MIAIGRYSEENSSFDRESYRAQWKLPFLVVFGFLHRFKVREFSVVKGDLLLALVASEIWLYNITRAIVQKQQLDMGAGDADSERFGKCNTFSIAQGLGISNATCRRKVHKLMDMGWVEMDEKRQLHITQACEDAFNSGANEETVADFISTARTLFKAMHLPLTPTGTRLDR